MIKGSKLSQEWKANRTITQNLKVLCDRSVCFHDLPNQQNDPAKQRSHKAMQLEKKSLFSLNVLSCILSYFFENKKKKSSGCKHSTILKNPKGCTSNIRHKDMLGLVQGKSCFLFCDVDIYLMSCHSVILSGRCYFRNTIISIILNNSLVYIFAAIRTLFPFCSFIYRTAVRACVIVFQYQISSFYVATQVYTRLLVATLFTGYKLFLQPISYQLSANVVTRSQTKVSRFIHVFVVIAVSSLL